MIQTIKTIARSAGFDRQRYAATRMCCERHVLAAVGRQHKRWIGRILCYHSIGQADWGVNDVAVSRLQQLGCDGRRQENDLGERGHAVGRRSVDQRSR